MAWEDAWARRVEDGPEQKSKVETEALYGNLVWGEDQKNAAPLSVVFPARRWGPTSRACSPFRPILGSCEHNSVLTSVFVPSFVSRSDSNAFSVRFLASLPSF